MFFFVTDSMIPALRILLDFRMGEFGNFLGGERLPTKIAYDIYIHVFALFMILHTLQNQHIFQ